MKKLFSVLLAIAMLLSLASVFAAEEETLTVWLWDKSFNGYAMQEAEKLYQKEHPNFKLNIIETSWDDVQAKVIAAGGGDLSQLPDIFLMQDNAFQKNQISYPAVFLDLTGKPIAFDKFAPAKLAYTMVEGKNFGVPFDSGAAIASWRTDILEKAGFKAEDLNNITWERFIEIGKTVYEKTGVPMLSYNNGGEDFIMMMLQSMGASLFTEDNKINISSNDAVKKVVDIYKKLLDAKVLKLVQSWDEYIKDLQNGGAVGTIQGCWIIGSLRAGEENNGKLAVTNIPRFDVEGGTQFTNCGGSSWAISANTKKAELAIDFLSKTFAGSVEFYETILEQAGALATYLPAGESNAYSRPQEFFGGQKIFEDIVSFSSKIPMVKTGVFYYEARNAFAQAMQKISGGADVQQSLDEAQSEADFNIAQ